MTNLTISNKCIPADIKAAGSNYIIIEVESSQKEFINALIKEKKAKAITKINGKLVVAIINTSKENFQIIFNSSHE